MSQKPTLTQRMTRWRDWSLATKLIALMVVPTIVVVALGVVLIRNQVDGSNSYAVQNAQIDVQKDTQGTLRVLYDNRDKAHDGKPVDAPGVQAALDELRTKVGGTTALDGASKEAWQAAQQSLSKLPKTNANGYNAAIDGLLNFDDVVSRSLADPKLASRAVSIHQLTAARDLVLRQNILVSEALNNGGLSANGRGQLRQLDSTVTARLNDFRTTAGKEANAELTQANGSAQIRERARIIQDAIKVGPEHDAGRQQLKIQPPKWQTDGNSASDAMGTVIGNLTKKLTDDGAAAEDDASNNAGLATLLLFVTLLASAAVAIVILRHLISSLRKVRVRALEVADDELPETVRRIRSGEQVATDIEPLGVGTNEDIGQLSAAFDRVHGEAVRLASEQAGLRADYDDVFINLSRRSQTLVQRQLRLIEQLERDEEDPDQLSTLFQMDHLATRMRRNNENLMLLSGAELGRRFAQTLPIADLMRAAISEIERYQRVQLQQPAAVSVVGYAASDLVRLVAELLDNATNFSAPETKVLVASERTDGGDLLIEITDFGIGMTDEDLAEVNEQLRVQTPEEVPVARRMGLFVVGRLAATHRIRVALRRGDERGLRVQVLVPRSLVEAAPERPEETGFDPIPETPLPVRRPGLAARRAGIPTSGGDPVDPSDAAGAAPSDASTESGDAASTGVGAAGLAGLAGAAGAGGAALFSPAGKDSDPTSGGSGAQDSSDGAEPGDTETTAWTGFSALNRRAEQEPDEFDADHAEHDIATGHDTGAEYDTATEHDTGAEYEIAGEREHDGVPAPESAAPGDPVAHQDGAEDATAEEPARRYDDEDSHLFGADAFPADAQQPYVAEHRMAADEPAGVNGHAYASPADQPGAETEEPATAETQVPHAAPASSASASNGWFAESGEEQENASDRGVFWGTANASWQRPVDEPEPEQEPEQFTSMGLPKRVPRKNLLPGSAGTSKESNKPAAPEHDPDEVKNRFASYRSGVSAARREVDAPSDAANNGHVDAPTTGEPMSAAPQSPGFVAPAEQSTQDTEEPTGLFGAGAESHGLFTHGEETPGHGASPAGDGLFAPGAEPGAAIDWPATDPEPEAAEPQYTSVGLPRRKPRASRPTPRPRGDAAMAPRDSQRVKERMASLQRGLTMGTQRSEPVRPEDHVDRQENE